MDALTKLLIVEDSEADQFIAVRRVRRLYPDAEILLAADHNAHLAGQVIDMRRSLGLWPPPEASSE